MWMMLIKSLVLVIFILEIEYNSFLLIKANARYNPQNIVID